MPGSPSMLLVTMVMRLCYNGPVAWPGWGGGQQGSAWAPHLCSQEPETKSVRICVLKSQPVCPPAQRRLNFTLLFVAQQCFQPDSRMGAEKRVSKVMAESLESGWFLLERSRTEVEIDVCIEVEIIIAKEILNS